jgi:tRNA threonylcarbamoyladenosine biosynthesis protein TsaE
VNADWHNSLHKNSLETETNPLLEKCLKKGIETASAMQTKELAVLLAKMIPENHTIALYGDLGTGKTTFVKGLAHAWNIKEPVTSPTFNIFSVYKGQRNLIHLDAYRLKNEEQFHDLMLEEFLTPPFCLAIEWPEKVSSYLSPSVLAIQFNITKQKQHCIRLNDPSNWVNFP